MISNRQVTNEPIWHLAINRYIYWSFGGSILMKFMGSSWPLTPTIFSSNLPQKGPFPCLFSDSALPFFNILIQHNSMVLIKRQKNQKQAWKWEFTQFNSPSLKTIRKLFFIIKYSIQIWLQKKTNVAYSI